MRFLLIEDDMALADCVRDILEGNEHRVDYCGTGEEGVELAEMGGHNLIILDIGLPGIPGTEVIKKLRNLNRTVPILVLSGRTQLESKLETLNCGADDFMIKPFHRDELLARIYALVRRSEGLIRQKLQIGNMQIDLKHQEVIGPDGPLDLTRKEYEIFELLCLRNGHPVTKTIFLDRLYGGMNEPDAKILDVFICNLRKKLAQANNGDHCIKTVWGRGYALRLPEAQAEQTQASQCAAAA